jgi:hypothetical protein
MWTSVSPSLEASLRLECGAERDAAVAAAAEAATRVLHAREEELRGEAKAGLERSEAKGRQELDAALAKAKMQRGEALKKMQDGIKVRNQPPIRLNPTFNHFTWT